jgi:hypothetical protein
MIYLSAINTKETIKITWFPVISFFKTKMLLSNGFEISCKEAPIEYCNFNNYDRIMSEIVEKRSKRRLNNPTIVSIE